MATQLEVAGKLIKKLNPVEGSGANGSWKKQEFVIETDEQFPKKACFNLWGDKTAELNNYNEGDMMTVSFNVESREYNERWYTDLRAWRLQKGDTSGGGASGAGQQQQSGGSYGGGQAQQAQPTYQGASSGFNTQPASASEIDDDGDLPF